MPAHVVGHLLRVGRLDPDGVTRQARLNPCPKCGALTAVGLDHDHAALTARVDLAPLSPAGELQALLADRATYELSRSARGLVVDCRMAERITGQPAGAIRGADVVAAHQCRSAPLPAAPSRIPVATRTRGDQPCPY